MPTLLVTILAILGLSSTALAADDGDSVMDHQDLDHDNDGIPTYVEGTDDLDGDGLGNHLDLDADGDGVLDVDEAGYGSADLDNNGRVDGGVSAWGVPLDVVQGSLPTLCEEASNVGENLYFDAPSLRYGTWGSIPEHHVPGWQTDASNGRIEIWNGWLPNTWATQPQNELPTRSQHVEVNGGALDNLFQSIVTNPGDTYVLTTAYRQRAWSTETLELFVDGVSQGTLAPGFDWTVETWRFTATSALTEIRFVGSAPNSGQVGNLLDIVGLANDCVLPDVNSDGQPDFLDDTVDGSGGPQSTTNGIAGGLESNGRMGPAMAQRTLLKRFGAPLPMLIGRSDLPAWVPLTGPGGSVPVPSTPGDLPTITNAKDVHGVDYIADDGTTVATILLVAAEGAHYEHSKPICDRAHGAVLESTSTARIDGHEVVGGRFVHGAASDNTRLLTLYGGLTDEAVEVASCWLLEDRPAPEPGQRVVTAQVWSSMPGAEDELAQAMLHQVRQTAEVTWKAEGCSSPEAWFAKADTLGGAIHLRVSNPHAVASQVQLSLTDYDGERRTERFDLDEGELSSLTLEPGWFLDGNAELLDASGEILDRVWLSDGFWASVDDALWRGDSAVEQWDVAPCDRPAAAAGLTLAGCATLEATVDDFVVAARVLPGAGVNITSWKGIGVHLTSTTEAQLCVESNQAQTGACVTLPANPDGGWVELPLADLHTLDAGARSPLFTASAISFVFDTAGPTSATIDSLTLLDDSPASIRSTEAMLASINTTEPPSAGCSSTGTAPAAWWFLGLLGLARRRP